MKTIKITEEQKTRLKEMLFPNGTESADPMRQYHDSKVVADGYVDNIDGGGEPLTGDRLGKTMCKNFPFGTAYYHVGVSRAMPMEEAEISDLYSDEEDVTGDGVPDKYNHADANYNQFGDFNELPGTVKTWLDKLVTALKQENLPPKKQIMVLNYIVDNAGLKGIPMSYKKETMKKIGAKQ